MIDRALLKRRAIMWVLIFACWTLLGLFSASRIYVQYSYYSDTPPTWRQSLTVALSDWYAWAILSSIIFWFARRFPIERGIRRDRWLLHLLAGALFTITKILIELEALQLIAGAPARSLSFIQFHPNFLTYLAIIGIIYAFDYYRKYREHELKASRLEARLAQAQLEALKMQLHPHFLFNTLHAISALIHKDVETADRMLARLSDLLRLTLENIGVQQVPLKQELEFLERYLEIEQTRFRDRLAVRMDIAPAALDALVPNLILQPLVENAIRHAIAPRASPGRIEISARLDNGRLHLQIRDDGPGLPNPALRKNGVGLANTRARLRQLYGAEQRFELNNASSGGLVVTLVLPFRTENQESIERNIESKQ